MAVECNENAVVGFVAVAVAVVNAVAIVVADFFRLISQPTQASLLRKQTSQTT